MQHLYKLPLRFDYLIRKDEKLLEKRKKELQTRIGNFTIAAEDKANLEESALNAEREIKLMREEIRRLDDEVAKKKNSPQCLLSESIGSKIHLILMTHYGEYRYDSQFGCSLWDHDFEILRNFGKWQDEMILSITKSIENNEPRLKQVNVKVKIDQEEFTGERPDVKKMKLKVKTAITARYRGTNELFHFDEDLYLSPISMD